MTIDHLGVGSLNETEQFQLAFGCNSRHIQRNPPLIRSIQWTSTTSLYIFFPLFQNAFFHRFILLAGIFFKTMLTKRNHFFIAMTLDLSVA